MAMSTIIGISGTSQPSVATIALACFLFGAIYLLLQVVYRASPFHKLHHVPGPFWARISCSQLLYHSYSGSEVAWFNHLHRIYGPTIRLGPNIIDISDGAALQAIYIDNGGFRKPDIYHNFMPDRVHKALFSETDPTARQPRVHAVGGVFSTAAVKKSIPPTTALAHEMTSVLQHAKRAASKEDAVDVLGLSRAFAAEAASLNVLGREWGALKRCLQLIDEGKLARGLRGDGTMDFYDAIGRYWYVPPILYQLLEICRRFFAGKAVAESYDILFSHVHDSVQATKVDMAKHQGTFQERLLHAGYSEAETTAQAADALCGRRDYGLQHRGLDLARCAQPTRLRTASRRDYLSFGSEHPDVNTVPSCRRARRPAHLACEPHAVSTYSASWRLGVSRVCRSSWYRGVVHERAAALQPRGVSRPEDVHTGALAG
jgi:hypothetical protein